MTAATQQFPAQKHQVYRARGKEVALVREAKWETKADNTRGRITHWLVHELTRKGGDSNGPVVFTGEPFEIAASELAPLHRVVLA